MVTILLCDDKHMLPPQSKPALKKELHILYFFWLLAIFSSPTTRTTLRPFGLKQAALFSSRSSKMESSQPTILIRTYKNTRHTPKTIVHQLFHYITLLLCLGFFWRFECIFSESLFCVCSTLTPRCFEQQNYRGNQACIRGIHFWNVAKCSLNGLKYFF